MGKIPFQKRFKNGSSHLTAFLLFLAVLQATFGLPIRSSRSTKRCNDACYRDSERYCKVIYGGRLAVCAKCEVPCSSTRQEDQRVCEEFCQEYHTTTETPLEERGGDGIHGHGISSLPVSPASEGLTTYELTSKRLTTNLLYTSVRTQKMTMVPLVKNTSITALHMSSKVSGRHRSRNRLAVGDVTFFLSVFLVLSVSSCFLSLLSYVIQKITVAFKDPKVRPCQRDKSDYEFVPFTETKGGRDHQDERGVKNPAVTEVIPKGQNICQTAHPTPQPTVISQKSDCIGQREAVFTPDCTYQDISRLEKKGSAAISEGRNKSFTPTHGGGGKMAMPNDPTSTLPAASSHEELVTCGRKP